MANDKKKPLTDPSPGRRRNAGVRAPGTRPAVDLQDRTVRAIFLRRIRKWTRDLAASAPPSVLADALTQPSARGTMVHVLSMTSPLGDEGEVERLRARALERGLAVRERLRDDAGGFRSTAWVVEHLGLRRQSVDKRRKEGRLLALETPRGFEFPACQFTADGTVSGLEDALQAMSGGGFWETLAGLVTPSPALEGRTVIQALQDARTEEERKRVVAVARAYMAE